MAQRPPPDIASNEKNEYIPTFITKKPFWVPEDDTSTSADYLEHQRLRKIDEQAKWYDRGKRKGPAATKYRKGACENCGSMTHKTKECLNRPRAQGARWTGKNIQADEVIQEVQLGWDAKRDRWNGYDASEYMNVVKDFDELEKLKRMARTDTTTASGDAEEARYTEESDMGRQQSTATRNLRMREDTAKYLLNLDPESASYDPKTRSMAEGGVADDAAAALLAADAFERASGDAGAFEQAQRFAWETQERGGDAANKIHLQANPTAGEQLHRQQEEEAAKQRAAQQKLLLERYGGTDHHAVDPLKGSAVTESEQYVEYDASGAVKGALVMTGKSKYAEDVFRNNHTSVWGSWWEDFQWGYACCHSTVKNSYCTGEAGKAAFAAAEARRRGDEEVHTANEGPPALNEDSATPHDADEHGHQERNASRPKKRTIDRGGMGVTEEELEAYKRAKTSADDPMRDLLKNTEAV